MVATKDLLFLFRFMVIKESINKYDLKYNFIIYMFIDQNKFSFSRLTIKSYI